MPLLKRPIYIDLVSRSPFKFLDRKAPQKEENLTPPGLQEAAEEGRIDAVKESAKLEDQNQEKLDGLVEKTETVLLKVRNIVPIFTSEIIIDTGKVTIIHRPFFFSESIQTVTIKNLTAINIETVPFLATVNLKDVNFAQNNFKVRWILKGRAERARRIMTGLMQSAKEGIDLKSLSDDHLAEKLEEIGKVRKATTSVSKA